METATMNGDLFGEPIAAGSMYSGPGCSTSSLLYEKACMERTAYYLSLSPMCQARVIAKHYCAYAMIARDLLEILECVAQGSNQNADAAIEHIVKTITDGHAHDFGLPLAWSNPTGHAQARSAAEGR